MCGRYSLETTYDIFASRYGLEFEVLEYAASSEIFPTQKQVVLLDNNQVQISQWGFPSRVTKQTLINARLETVQEKPSFKNSFQHQRCLVPATSFFEWEKVFNEKIKRKVKIKNQLIFSMAGIVTESAGQWYYSILTMPSNQQFESIHHRMPVILPAKEELRYLNKNTPTSDVFKLCQQTNPEFLII